VVRHLALAEDSAEPQTDAALLARYALHRDSAAFAELLHRHGPVVLGVCRRILPSSHDAEDAFQAVFLVLARKADAVRPAGQVGNWLYGVAVRTANKARVAAARRWRREMASVMSSSRMTANPERERGGSFDPAEIAELRAIIDAELSRLPDRLRAAVVLCDLGGKTRAEAARELRCPEGTVAARLHQARKLLADRLARRGVTLAAGLASLLGSESIGSELGTRTLAAAEAFASGAASPAVPPTVLALAEGMVRTMTAGKWKLILGLFASLLLAGGGLLWAAGGGDGGVPPLSPAAVAEEIAAPAPNTPASPWKETKVLDIDGWLAGSIVYSADGKTLFVGGTEGSGRVRAYTADGFKQVWESRVDGRLAALAISPDGKTLAATVKDGVQFLDPATGKLGDMLEEKGSEPLAVAYLPELLSADEVATKVIFGNASTYLLKVWLKWPNVSTIKTSTIADGQKPADPHAVPLAVDPRGKRAVVTGPMDRDTGRNVLWAWAAGSGQSNEVLLGHKAAVTSAAWSKDGKIIVTGDADGVVLIWDAEKFTLVGRGEVREAESRISLGGRVAAVAVSPDGGHIAAAVVRTVPGIGQGAYAEEVFVLRRSDQPKGKVTRRMSDNLVEINLGTGDQIKPGLKLTVLPSDYAVRGRESRMRQFRVPDEQGNYRTVEQFIPKATVEVVEVLGPELSRARITYEYDDIRERAVTGDLLYDIGFQPEDLKPISSHRAGGPFEGVASLAFSPDGKTLASAFCNFTHLTRLGELVGKVRIFAVAPVPKPDDAGPGLVADIRFSPDGKQYVVVADGVAVHDAATRQRLWHAPGLGAGYLPDGKSILVAGPKKVEERDAATGKVLKEYPGPKTNWALQRVAFSPGGKRYAVHVGFNVRLYDTATGFETVRLADQHEPGGGTILGGAGGNDLDWSPDGKKLAAVGVLVESGKVGFAEWDAETGTRVLGVPGDLLAGPRSLAYSPDGRKLGVLYKSDLKIWVDRKAAPERIALMGDNMAVAFMPDGRPIIASEARLHNGKPDPEGRYVRRLHLYIEDPKQDFGGLAFFDRNAERPPKALPVAALAISPDGKLAITGTSSIPGQAVAGDPRLRGEVKVWKLEEEKEPNPDPMPEELAWKETRKFAEYGNRIDAIAWSPREDSFAVGGEGGEVVVHGPTGTVALRFAPNPAPVNSITHRVYSLAYSPNGELLAVSHRDGVTLHDAATGKRKELPKWKGTLAPGPLIHSLAVAFSPDGKLLAIAGADLLQRSARAPAIRLQLLDLTTGEDVVQRDWPALPPAKAEPGGANPGGLSGVDPPITTALAFSPDGLNLAVTRNTRGAKPPARVEVLDVKTGRVVAELRDGAAWVVGLAWSKDGKRVATGRTDAKVIVWDAGPFKPLRTLDLGDGVQVSAVAFEPDTGTLAIGQYRWKAGPVPAMAENTSSVQIWDPITGKELQRFGDVVGMRYSSLSFSPKKGVLLSARSRTWAQPPGLPLQPAGEVVVWERKP
jgi:RNA polymerase sigma factor (sigma-70 family)